MRLKWLFTYHPSDAFNAGEFADFYNLSPVTILVRVDDQTENERKQELHFSLFAIVQKPKNYRD